MDLHSSELSDPPAIIIAMHAQLADEDRAILEFEDQRWRYPGAKESAIRDLFKVSPTRYHQLINHLIDQPAAEAALPQLVRRLRRLRDARRRTHPHLGQPL